MDQWFNIRFNDSIKLITLEELNATGIMDASCLFYGSLVKALSIHYQDYSDSMRQDIYSVFKKYLQTGPTPRCYTAGNDSWIVYYLQRYLTYCSATDLESFSSNETLLQQFSVDPTTLAMVATLDLTEDLKIYYAQLLATEKPNFPLQGIPENILCYAIGELNIGVTNVSQTNTILGLLKKCNISNGTNLGTEVLSGLLSSVTNITSDFITSLGSLAAGLPTSTIMQNTSGSVLVQSLGSLSAIDGWSVAQASVIVTKMKQSGFKITMANLESLGSLIIGVQSSEMNKLTAQNILALAANNNFSTYMVKAPVVLKQRFVQKVILASAGTNIFQTVPANLASEIPASYLLTPSLNINAITNMTWTTSQAQVFFKKGISTLTNYSMLSTYTLQGFTCGAANTLSNSQYQNLIKSMNGKSVTLGSSQLSCIARHLTKGGAPNDFTSYPSNVLLYFRPYTDSSTCRNFFNLVAKANIDLLPQGSPQRNLLLTSAITCLKINTAAITKANLQALGSLACALTNAEIISADPYVLQALQTCSSFTDAQKSAIVVKLKATYGNPSQWTVSTMKQIGNLASTIDGATLVQISTSVKRMFFPGFLTVIKTSFKTTFSYTMSQLKVSFRRVARAAPDCDELTTDMIAKQREYIVATYTAAQLDACLSNITLLDNLANLGPLAFADDQLMVLKNKLDTIFPNGVGEEYLIQIGNIARIYSAEKIHQWNITSVDTLGTLLGSATWQNNDSNINAMVAQYLQVGYPNATIDGTTLTVLAPYICGLNETLIQTITSDDLTKSTNPLDTSMCTQSKKNLLFSKMKMAYLSSENSSNAYFQIMKTVIGGARAADLIQFATGSQEMDLSLFTSLNPNEVKQLNAQNIKDLLGDNVLDINTVLSSEVLQAWVSASKQTEINKLGLNVTTGALEPIPVGFIVINPVTQTSGAASHRILSLLLSCTLAVVFYMNNRFL
ncbi:mesothelin-like [Mixophyes fleayi]|uniref:mesothelin-like n=1 Tax=Mixophyes fleayi TaxID=3061075 RepID=UPI003F4DD676